MNGFFYAVVFLVFGGLATQLEVSSDAGESLLPNKGYRAESYKNFLEHFQSDKSIRLIWEDLACSKEGWSQLVEVEALISGSSHVLQVSGLSTPSTVYARPLGIELELNSFAESEFGSASERCHAARDYDLFNGRFISHDLRAISTNIQLSNETDSNLAIADLQALLEPYSEIAHRLGGRLYLAGESVMSAEILEVTNRGTKLVLLMPFLSAILVFVVSGSFRAACMAILSCLYSIVIVLGFMSAAGISSTPITSLVTFLLIPISSAFVIHSYGFHVRTKNSDDKKSMDAFYIAGLTTAIGFGSTAISSIPDIRSMGIAGCVGVLATTNFVTGFVLPRFARSPGKALSAVVPRWAITSAGVQITIAVLLFFFTALGLSRVYVSYNPSDYLPLSNSVRADFERLKPWFGRMTVPLVIELPRGVDDVSKWEAAKKLVDVIEQNERDVIHVSWHYQSIATMTKAITLDENGLGMEFPQSDEMLRQVYEALDYGLRDQFIAADESNMLVLIDVSFLGSDRFVTFQKDILREASRLELSAEFVGRVPYFFEIGHSIAFEIGVGLVVTLILISCVFLFYFRSLKLTLIAAATNLVPVLAGVSVFGILNVPLDLGSAIVAAIAFGLVIDDSTHYLVRYKSLRDMGYDSGSAVLRCSRELSGVIALTTISIVACFFSLVFVELQLFHDFAYLIAVTMIAALVTDLYILPRVLILAEQDEFQS